MDCPKCDTPLEERIEKRTEPDFGRPNIHRSALGMSYSPGTRRIEEKVYCCPKCGYKTEDYRE